jgi:wobble nucleotide-excising tRNase
MKFHVYDLTDCLYDCHPQLKRISYKLVHKGRWRSEFRLVFSEGDKFYGVTREEGNDENCDSTPFETDENNYVECEALKPVQKTITEYVPIA